MSRFILSAICFHVGSSRGADSSVSSVGNSPGISEESAEFFISRTREQMLAYVEENKPLIEDVAYYVEKRIEELELHEVMKKAENPAEEKGIPRQTLEVEEKEVLEENGDEDPLIQEGLIEEGPTPYSGYASAPFKEDSDAFKAGNEALLRQVGFFESTQKAHKRALAKSLVCPA